MSRLESWLLVGSQICEKPAALTVMSTRDSALITLSLIIGKLVHINIKWTKISQLDVYRNIPSVNKSIIDSDMLEAPEII
jgi:hypothetical protein